MGRASRTRLVAAVSAGALASFLMTTAAEADVTASIQNGVLIVEDDPGASTELVVAEYFNPILGDPYYAPNGVDLTAGRFVGTRAGPGCVQAGTGVRCPVPPVTSIIAMAGDGADRVRIGGLEPALPDTGRP